MWGRSGVAPPHVELTVPERDRIAEFKEVAEMMPDDPVVRFGLAGAYLEGGQAESAVTEYEETIRLKPEYFPSEKLGKGGCCVKNLRKMGDFKERSHFSLSRKASGLSIKLPIPKNEN